jgi:cobalt/nickel transport protein
MTKFKYWLEIITVIAIAAFCILFLYTSSLAKGAVFSGTDSVAAEKISEMSGTSPEDIHPIIPQWVPPSAEVESTLFALQAAIGGVFIGGVFGFWIGQKKRQ